MPPDVLVAVRAYKDVDLSGGTLVESVPQAGIGNVLLTDHLIERLGMDQVAVVDSDRFPPLAVLRAGHARFPVRIHADARSRVAVMRSEFTLRPAWTREVALALLGWARAQGLSRIVVLDAVVSDEPSGAGGRDPRRGAQARRGRGDPRAGGRHPGRAAGGPSSRGPLRRRGWGRAPGRATRAARRRAKRRIAGAGARAVRDRSGRVPHVRVTDQRAPSTRSSSALRTAAASPTSA